MLALKWHDVDLEGSSLQVRGNLQNVGGVYHIVEPKTKSSRRRIALPVTTVEALRAHRMRQEDERQRASEGWEDNDLVFPNTIGRPLDAMNIQGKCHAQNARRPRRLVFSSLRSGAGAAAVACIAAINASLAPAFFRRSISAIPSTNDVPELLTLSIIVCSGIFSSSNLLTSCWVSTSALAAMNAQQQTKRRRMRRGFIIREGLCVRASGLIKESGRLRQFVLQAACSRV